MTSDVGGPAAIGEAPDVLVVGAGPTGLALAAQLRAYGVRFRIVDRAVDRVHESRALAIQPRTLEVLAGLGVTDRLIALGNPAVRLRVHAGARSVQLPLFDLGLADTAYPFLLFLSQAETERVLGEHLTESGVTIERGVELVGIRQTDRDVACWLRVRDGAEDVVAARYVVGCDGARSTVREQAGIGFEGRSYPQTFVLADVEANGIEPDHVHAFMAERGMLFFFPLGTPATWRVLAIRPRHDPPPADRPVTLDDVQALVDAHTTTPVRLHDPVWMTNFRLHNRGATRYRAGRIYLAGDAAHIHSPAGAQGMNTGIQDAINLGWKLALTVTGRATPALLDTYEAERAPVGRRVLRFTDRAFTIGTSTNPLIRIARTRLVARLMPLAARSRHARAYGFRTISQLAIHYRHGPLSASGHDAPRRGPKPGDRLPDGPITRAGQQTTLHAALAGPGFHLLLSGPSDSWSPSTRADLATRYAGLVTIHRLTPDADGNTIRRLGLRHHTTAHYLIRPDGHLGYRGGDDLTGLRTYLRRWLQMRPMCC